MGYWLVHWSHDLPDDPIWMAYEVTEDRSVPRMVEHSPDGRTECRTAEEEGWHTLVDQPFDPLIEDTDEFTTTKISAEEFERRWTKHT